MSEAKTGKNNPMYGKEVRIPLGLGVLILKTVLPKRVLLK